MGVGGGGGDDLLGCFIVLEIRPNKCFLAPFCVFLELNIFLNICFPFFVQIDGLSVPIGSRTTKPGLIVILKNTDDVFVFSVSNFFTPRKGHRLTFPSSRSFRADIILNCMI